MFRFQYSYKLVYETAYEEGWKSRIFAGHVLNWMCGANVFWVYDGFTLQL